MAYTVNKCVCSVDEWRSCMLVLPLGPWLSCMSHCLSCPRENQRARSVLGHHSALMDPVPYRRVQSVSRALNSIVPIPYFAHLSQTRFSPLSLSPEAVTSEAKVLALIGLWHLKS